MDVTRQEGSAALPIGERPPEARRSRCRRHRRITGHGDVRERILRNEPTTVNRPRPFASPRVAHISVSSSKPLRKLFLRHVVNQLCGIT